MFSFSWKFILFLLLGLVGWSSWVTGAFGLVLGRVILAEFFGQTFLEDIAKPLCFMRNKFCPTLTNNFWFLSGWGFLRVISFCGILGIMVGKLNFGIFRGVTKPGLLFLFGV